jgi:hypothetical protein
MEMVMDKDEPWSTAVQVADGDTELLDEMIAEKLSIVLGDSICDKVTALRDMFWLGKFHGAYEVLTKPNETQGSV